MPHVVPFRRVISLRALYRNLPLVRWQLLPDLHPRKSMSPDPPLYGLCKLPSGSCRASLRLPRALFWGRRAPSSVLDRRLLPDRSQLRGRWRPPLGPPQQWQPEQWR